MERGIVSFGRLLRFECGAGVVSGEYSTGVGSVAGSNLIVWADVDAEKAEICG